MIFNEYKIIKKIDYIKLYAEMLVQFENGNNENIYIGTPKWWDDYFLKKIDINEYDIYFICTHTVFYGKYNRITDYKKVWGLNQLEKGIYENSYCNDIGKVYFGIIKSNGEEGFRSSKASTMLLIKKNSNLSCDTIFEIFKSSKYNFRKMYNSEDFILRKIQELYINSILLRYECINEISLSIYGKEANELFSEIDFSEFDNKTSDLVCRRI